MRRPLPAILLLAALPAAAQLPEAWRNWRYSARVVEATADGLAGVEVPATVTGHSQRGWTDLRLIDDQGREVPYILFARRDKYTSESREARLLEVTYKPGESTQGIVDLGAKTPVHNSIEIRTSEPDFFAWVELSISPDGNTWRLLRERAPIYRFRKEGLEGNQTISYSPAFSRYLRVRVLEPARRFALDGVLLAHEVIEEAERQPVDAAFRRDPAAPAQQTWWVADLGEAQPPASEMRFEIDEPEFYRAIRVRTSDDGKTWSVAGSGDIYRIRLSERAAAAASSPVREQLKVTLPERQARFWRVEVLDRNDPSLAANVRLFVIPRSAVFRTAPGRAYQMVYGNTRAAAAEYNMARLVDAAALEAAAPARLAAEEINAGYVDPAPWSERNPAVLWLALGVAVLVLGALAVRALRSGA
jgi:hypothetical protein